MHVILFFFLSFDFTLTVCKHDDVELKKLHEVHNKTWEEISVSLLQTSIDVGLPGLRATLASLWFAAAEVFLQRLPVSFLSGLHCDWTFPRTSFPGWGSTRVWCTFNLVLLFTSFGYNIKHEHLISDLGNNIKAWNLRYGDFEIVFLPRGSLILPLVVTPVHSWHCHFPRGTFLRGGTAQSRW